jgi:membrane protease YdiL (CAAX protease family)
MEHQDIDPISKIVEERFKFLIEVTLVFLAIFIFLLIPRVLLPFFIKRSSIIYGPLYYFLRAIAVIIAIPIALYFISNLIDPSKTRTRVKEEMSLAKEHIKLLSGFNLDFKDQLLYGVLILFIIFIPLDFLVYFFIPEMLRYTGEALSSQSTDTYLLQSYQIFLFSVIIIQICVSIYEETVSRGFLTMRGKEYMHKMSAAIISSLYFGLMHFAYFLNPASRNYPIWFPFIWFLQTFIVAIILSILVLKKKSLFPVIFAHALNNIISAHAVWNYLQGNNFLLITIYLYIPLMIIGLVLFIWQFSKVKNAISIFINDIKTYTHPDSEINESKRDVYLRISFDIFIGVIILFLGLFIFGV